MCSPAWEEVAAVSTRHTQHSCMLWRWKVGVPRVSKQYSLKQSFRSKNISRTRMHSSRMRTGRSLTVCRSLLPGRCVSVPGGGVWSPGRCLILVGVWSGVSVPRGGGVCPGEACLPPGGCLLLGVRVCLWGVVVSQHALRQTPPPPVNRMTNTSKNITLATTSLRPIKTVNCGHNVMFV